MYCWFFCSLQMPVCSYFLSGDCTKENCPCRHVNVNKDAKVCQEFLNGYCAKGENVYWQFISANICFKWMGGRWKSLALYSCEIVYDISLSVRWNIFLSAKSLPPKVPAVKGKHAKCYTENRGAPWKDASRQP